MPPSEIREVRIPLFVWVLAVTVFGFTLAWLLA